VTGETARLFFAAWPAPDTQRALGRVSRALQRECGGRALPARNIHLTLVFLGDIERARLAGLERVAESISAPRFQLRIDRVEYWRHNRIVWAGVAECPPALPRLVERLEGSLTAAGYRLDRRAYVPHITLLRNARREPATSMTTAIAWPVSRFALVESAPRDRGRVYEVLREWPLEA
jgi:2'-5' RNA ligase